MKDAQDSYKKQIVKVKTFIVQEYSELIKQYCKLVERHSQHFVFMLLLSHNKPHNNLYGPP